MEVAIELRLTTAERGRKHECTKRSEPFLRHDRRRKAREHYNGERVPTSSGMQNIQRESGDREKVAVKVGVRGRPEWNREYCVYERRDRGNCRSGLDAPGPNVHRQGGSQRGKKDLEAACQPTDAE